MRRYRHRGQPPGYDELLKWWNEELDFFDTQEGQLFERTKNEFRIMRKRIDMYEQSALDIAMLSPMPPVIIAASSMGDTLTAFKNAAILAEQRDIITVIRSTTWSGSEEIVSMLKQRISRIETILSQTSSPQSSDPHPSPHKSGETS